MANGGKCLNYLCEWSLHTSWVRAKLLRMEHTTATIVPRAGVVLAASVVAANVAIILFALLGAL